MVSRTLLTLRGHSAPILFFRPEYAILAPANFAWENIMHNWTQTVAPTRHLSHILALQCILDTFFVELKAGRPHRTYAAAPQVDLQPLFLCDKTKAYNNNNNNIQL